MFGDVVMDMGRECRCVVQSTLIVNLLHSGLITNCHHRVLFSLPYRPDLIKFKELKAQQADKNLRNAFDVAANDLGIARLLDPEGRYMYCDSFFYLPVIPDCYAITAIDLYATTF